MPTTLTPMRTVGDAKAAVAFYGRAFGAIELRRVVAPTGHVVAELAFEDERFYVVDENVKALNTSPTTVRGTSVRINLVVGDPDAPWERAIAARATVVFRSAISRVGCGRAVWRTRSGATG